jgi:hypothetical protein
LYAHATQTAPTLNDRGVSAHPALDVVLARAMAKAPDDRYLSAGDLGSAAIAAASGESLSRADRSVASGEAAPSEPNIGRGLAATRPPPPPKDVDAGIMGRGLAATRPVAPRKQKD